MSTQELGRRFGRLVTVREVRVHRRRGFVCRCDCGTEVAVSRSNLLGGNSRSCGCLFRERRAESAHRRATGNIKDHELYLTYDGIKRRCLDPRHKDYPAYGGRGVSLYFGWRTARSFIEGVLADIGPRPDASYTIDRISPNGNYGPGEIRWATRLEQRHNQRKSWRFISDEEVIAIRRRYAAGGVSQDEIAREFDTNQAEVSRVVRGLGRYGRIA